MKLAGVAWLDCGRSTQEFTSYMAGFAYPLRSHLRLDDQHAAQSPCLAILVPLGMWRRTRHHLPRPNHPLPLTPIHRKNDRLAPHRQQASSRIWRVATSPTRVLQAQITQRCTRYVAVHPIRRGAMPTDRVHRLPQQAQPRALPPNTLQPAVSDEATRPRNTRVDSAQDPLHPLRHGTPVTSRCTRSEEVQCLQIGCTASHNKPNRGQFVPTDPNHPPRTLRHSFDMLARLRTRGATPVTSRYTRYVAMHPLRRGAPDQKGCNAYGSGAPPLSNKPN